MISLLLEQTQKYWLYSWFLMIMQKGNDGQENTDAQKVKKSIAPL